MKKNGIFMLVILVVILLGGGLWLMQQKKASSPQTNLPPTIEQPTNEAARPVPVPAEPSGVPRADNAPLTPVAPAEALPPALEKEMGKGAPANSASPAAAPQAVPAEPLAPKQDTNKERSQPSAEAQQAHLVTYSDSGFSPSVVTIKKGEAVTFMNASGSEMWPASAIHPTHSAYPTTGGCLGSTFDACRGIEKGMSWSFVFDATGTWGYHNHLNPKATGKIIVQ